MINELGLNYSNIKAHFETYTMEISLVFIGLIAGVLFILFGILNKRNKRLFIGLGIVLTFGFILILIYFCRGIL